MYKNRNSFQYESYFRVVLPIYLVFIFLTTLIGAYVGFLEHNSWKMGDWLINYQGGMIRRGFLGELIYLLSVKTHISPGLLVFTLQTLFYGLFLYFSYSLLVNQKKILSFVLLIFSPFLFLFQIYDFQGGYRKEIIYFALIAYLTWSAVAYTKKNFERILYISLILYPLIILSHEMLAFYLPYLIVIYFSVVPYSKNRLVKISILILPSLLSFAVSLYYSGMSHQIIAIRESLKDVDYQIILGSITWLDKTTEYAVNQVLLTIKNNSYLTFYLVTLLLALVAFIPVRTRFKPYFKNKLLFGLILLSIFSSFALFAVAMDWGRFIYIHLVSWFFLSMIKVIDPSPKNPKKSSLKSVKTNLYNKIKISVFLLLFTFYCLAWHIPYCCKPIPFAQEFKDNNLFKLMLPYKRLALRLDL